MSLTNKLKQIAENQQKVYEAGQRAFADAIPTISTTVSTDKMYLRIDDISEVPHDVTIFNSQYSDSTYVYGKNLLDEEWLHNINNWEVNEKNQGNLKFSLPVGTYTFSAISNTDYTVYLYFYKSSDNGETWVHQGDVLSGAGAKSVNVQVGPDELLRFFVYPFKALIGDTEALKVQAEWGSVATTYEPYKRQYVETPWDEEKQMHIGIAKSMYPTMTIEGYYDDMGVNATYNKSYSKQAAYDEFWDSYQRNGNLINYSYAFCGNGWTDVNFKPKYSIISNNCDHLFTSSPISKVPCLLDTSTSTNFNYMFAVSNIVDAPTLDLTKCGVDNFQYTFYSAAKCKSIKLINVQETLKFTASFTGCTALESITFDGTIGNNISFSKSSNLTHASIMNIIEHLRDLVADGITTKTTLTLGATNLEKLTDEEKAKATQKGWTLA